jgi:hypothetical protein
MTSNRYKEAVAVLAICAVVILFVLVPDNNANKVQHPATMEAEPTPEWWATATLTPHPLSTTAAPPVPTATNTPTIDSLDWCIGWWCTLRGVVYADTASPGNELEGVLVKLSQFSFCSPTSGEHETTTGPDGTFEFDVYLHDTDSFRFQAELEGYEPASKSFGGFDCLYCSCPPVELVLQSSDTLTALDKGATPVDGLRNNATLTYTLTLSGPGLSVRLRDSLPAAVRYISASITSTVTPAAVYSSTVNAVVWQGTLPTDTAQVIRFQVTPGVTGTGSLDLALPIVNTAWLTDTENGRSVSATVIVNGHRLCLPLAARNH